MQLVLAIYEYLHIDRRFMNMCIRDIKKWHRRKLEVQDEHLVV